MPKKFVLNAATIQKYLQSGQTSELVLEMPEFRYDAETATLCRHLPDGTEQGIPLTKSAQKICQAVASGHTSLGAVSAFIEPKSSKVLPFDDLWRQQMANSKLKFRDVFSISGKITTEHAQIRFK